MTKTVILPTLDHTGKLTPLVLEALEGGATAAIDPANPHGPLILTFAKEAQAKAFKGKIADIVFGSYAKAAASMGETLNDMIDEVAAASDIDQPE